MSWQDFEDYAAEVRSINPCLGHEPYVTMDIMEGYKQRKTPVQVAAKFFLNSPCDLSSVIQAAVLEFDTEDEAKRFYEVIDEVTKDAKYRAIRHIIEEQEKR